MQCPVDKNELQEINETGFSYLQCPACQGVWMRERALRTAVEQIDPDAVSSIPQAADLAFKSKETDTNNVTKCPNDGLDVYEHRLGTVIVDICPGCGGVWLDPGEFEAIKGEVERQEIPKTLGKSMANAVAYLVHLYRKNDAEAAGEDDDDES